MVDLDKLRGTAEGFSKSQKGTRAALAAIAATVTLSGNLNAQTVEHSQDETPNGTETKVQNSDRQNTSENKTADFAAEAAQMGIKIDTAAVAKPQEDISHSKDTAVVQDVYKNGNIKESTTVHAAHTVNTSTGTPYVSNEITSIDESFSRKGIKTASQEKRETSFERFDPSLGKLTKEKEIETTREYDRKGRERSVEYSMEKNNRQSSGALDKSYGYDAEKSWGSSSTEISKYDKKGRETQKELHSQNYGTTASKTDTQYKAYRGKDLNGANGVGQKEYTEVYGHKDRNGTTIEVKNEKFNRKGQLKKFIYGKVTGNGDEIYRSIKNKKKKSQTIEISASKEGNISGTKITAKTNGEEKRTQLSNRALVRHLKKLRNGINSKLEKASGFENIKDYGNAIPEIDNQAHLPLNKIFEKNPNQQAFETEKEKAAASTQQEIDKARQITAADIVKQTLAAKQAAK